MYSLWILHQCCSHLFQFLIPFEGINMRLAWSLKQGHAFQWQKICQEEKKKKAWGTSGNTWASILGSVVLFNTSRWGFLSRDLWHLCGNLSQKYTWPRVSDLISLGRSRVRPSPVKKQSGLKKCPSSDHVITGKMLLCLHNWELDNWKLTQVWRFLG